MALSTSDYYDMTKYSVKDMVTVSHTEALSVARGFFAEVGGIFGGKSDIMNKKIIDVEKHLKTKLLERISGSDKIIGIKFNFTEFGRSEANSFLTGFASGTLITPKRSGGSMSKKTRKNRK